MQLYYLPNKNEPRRILHPNEKIPAEVEAELRRSRQILKQRVWQNAKKRGYLQAHV